MQQRASIGSASADTAQESGATARGGDIGARNLNSPASHRETYELHERRERGRAPTNAGGPRLCPAAAFSATAGIKKFGSSRISGDARRVSFGRQLLECGCPLPLSLGRPSLAGTAIPLEERGSWFGVQSGRGLPQSTTLRVARVVAPPSTVPGKFVKNRKILCQLSGHFPL